MLIDLLITICNCLLLFTDCKKYKDFVGDNGDNVCTESGWQFHLHGFVDDNMVTMFVLLQFHLHVDAQSTSLPHSQPQNQIIFDDHDEYGEFDQSL